MARLKQKIWTIFVLIFITGLLCFSYLTVYLHNNNSQRFYNEQESHIALFSNSVHAFFRTQDSLLHVLGLQLLNKHPALTEAIHDKTLDDIMADYPALLGLGLVAYDGTPLIASSNFNLEQLPNLMKLPQTKSSFQLARSINKISTGPTYMVNALATNTYAMPIRRSIFVGQLKDKPVAVMTAGIRIDDTPLFGIGKKLDRYHQVQIIRNDGFYQFSSDPSVNYSNKADDSLVHLLNSVFEKDKSEGTSSVQSLQYIQGDKNQHIVAKYDQYSEMYFVSIINDEYINQVFLSNFLIIFALFASLMLSLFVLIRSIAISETKTKSKLVYQAEHDSLTKLPNRQYLRNNIHQWITSDGEKQPFAVIYIDIDNFKSVNDSYGHEFGDRVLMQASWRLRGLLAPDGLLVRESSDEFIYLTHSCDKPSLKLIATQISTSLSEPYIVENNSVLLGSCIGISIYPVHGDTLNELLGTADIALHRAKKKRNSTSFFTSKMQEEHSLHVQLEQRLRLAIDKKTPFMVYQPQVDKHGRIYGVEALARWIDDKLGFVSPDKFIAIAESTGLMGQLGKLIIEKSLSDISTINKSSDVPLRLSINISVRQFTEEQFADDILNTIARFGLSPHIITLEITENLFIEDLEIIKPKCAYLQKKGIQISLDDFGTGYSSLSMLNKLAIDELKIDKSFVERIEESQRARSMITNIISIAEQSGMSILAEGVETLAQQELLIGYKCHQFQGYYFSKPLSYSDLHKHMNQKSKIKEKCND